ncbi:MAG TPA: hypothetical protein VK606_02800, partial [Verrucomicrobiae bacterium]|nr:hypothetical protein [Verrucomicrobiae bacterium]
MELAATAFLAASVAAGFGLSYLIGVPLLLEERMAFGAVLGAAAVAGLGFTLALFVRDVTALTVLLALGIVLVVAAAAVASYRKLIGAEIADARARWLASPRSPGHPWPL